MGVLGCGCYGVPLVLGADTVRKAHLPGTVVPGAQRVVDRYSGIPVYDKQGRAVWRMPRPKGTVRHAISAGSLTRPKPGRPTHREVPVYRALSASLARHYRAQMRRADRKRK